MMTNKSRWLVAGLAGALCAAGISFKVTAAEAPARPRAQLAERVKEKLNLSEDQVEKIKAEVAADKDVLKDLILKLHEARVGLRDAIQAANASESSVRKAAEKVGAAQTDLSVERFKLFRKINPILTEDQRAKVKEFQGQLDEYLDTAITRMGERLRNQ